MQFRQSIIITTRYVDSAPSQRREHTGAAVARMILCYDIRFNRRIQPGFRVHVRELRDDHRSLIRRTG